MEFFEAFARVLTGIAAGFSVMMAIKIVREYRQIKAERDHEHDFHDMHHLDEEGKHYCPTGFVQCAGCGYITASLTPWEQHDLWGKWDRDAIGRAR